jgi:prepilin-type N-terminal cleavage/methylation domain-containing protein
MQVQILKILARAKLPRGVTLLESLVAMMVVGILMTAVAPLIALSAAARVQARRVDQATQAARGFLDKVAARTSAVNSSSFPTQLIVPTTGCSPGTAYTFDCVGAPGSLGGISAVDLGAINDVRVDGNGNGFSVFDPQDFVIQPMRNNITLSFAGGFEAAVRVYRADAFAPLAGDPSQLGATWNGQELLKGYEPACASAQIVFTASLGNKSCPLVFMKADILR